MTIAIVLPRSKSAWKGLVIVFPRIVENTENIVASSEGLSTLIPQTFMAYENFEMPLEQMTILTQKLHIDSPNTKL